MEREGRNSPDDVGFKPAGVGCMVTRGCMGCSKNKITTGGAGVGVRWRCAACIERRQRQKETA